MLRENPDQICEGIEPYLPNYPGNFVLPECIRAVVDGAYLTDPDPPMWGILENGDIEIDVPGERIRSA